jgi:hypothetical protein
VIGGHGVQAPRGHQAPPSQFPVHAFVQEMVHGAMWGNDAAANALANAWGVQITIHHVGDDGNYSVVVGDGGLRFPIQHSGNHYDAFGPGTDYTPPKPSCLHDSSPLPMSASRPWNAEAHRVHSR